MSVVATVTAKTGPAIQDTAIVLTGITAITYDFERQVVSFFKGQVNAYPWKEFDLTGVTTLTISLSGGVYTVVIS